MGIEIMKCSVESTLEEVLKCIDVNGKKAAFLVDRNDIMVVILTDGDIRRCLLD